VTALRETGRPVAAINRKLANRAVLVTWRGADWPTLSSLLEADVMPNLKRLVEEGVLAPSVPALSYSAVASGRRADPSNRVIWDLLGGEEMRSIVGGMAGHATG
jgi:hypothetical protein